MGEAEPTRVLVRTRDGAVYTETVPERSGEKPRAVIDAQLTGPYGSPLGFCVSSAYCSGILTSDPFPAHSAVPSKIKTIASVLTFANPYDISFGDVTTYAGRPVFDLRLKPRYDPSRYELRGMLIDAGDYHVAQMRYAIPQRGAEPVTIRYDFGAVGDVWYLRYVCVWVPDAADAPGGCGVHSTELNDFAFPASAPNWLFNLTLWRQHMARHSE